MSPKMTICKNGAIHPTKTFGARANSRLQMCALLPIRNSQPPAGLISRLHIYDSTSKVSLTAPFLTSQAIPSNEKITERDSDRIQELCCIGSLWTKGATLPTALSGSSLAVVGYGETCLRVYYQAPGSRPGLEGALLG